MDRISLLVSGLVGSFVALVLSEYVLFRAASLLSPDFDRDAFLIHIGGGPMAGLVTLVCGAIAFWGCRTLLRRLVTRGPQQPAAPGPPPSRTLTHQAAIYGVRGTLGGLAAGATIAWVLIRGDGMGNGGDTSIVRYEVQDFIEPSLLGMGICLGAALSLRQRFARVR